jgi:UDP-N-acetylglucosamine 3-dehydrogenase
MDKNKGRYRVGIIGTGLPWKTEGATGFGMSRAHAKGYIKSAKCDIVALSDILEPRMSDFNQAFCEGKATHYTDFTEMLAKENLDIVSIATWPHLHAPMTIAAAQAGVKAIHCEKPMAGTFGEAREMARVCAEYGVQLTFNHQRRHLPTFQTAKRLIADGAIGELTRLEGSCSNLLDWGTHWLNIFMLLNNESLPVWVMGQVDARKPVSVFGVPHDTDGLCQVGYENGVYGLLCTGELGEKMIGCSIRAIGTEGMIEMHNAAPHLRIRGKGDAHWRVLEGPETLGGLHGGGDVDPNADNVVDLVNALENGTQPLCDVSNALATTEVIYATYESARRRGRIDLPLTIDDSPLAALIESGIFPDAKNIV